MPELLKKFRRLKREIEEINPACDIEWRRRNKRGNVKQVIDAGCNVIVAGSAVFEGGKIAENISALRARF
jgi:ribulose-phosphate 3-epimerase